ncbi:hypothetical protein C4561_04865 [candidate division WWE3 bacterium]|jgi:hypothetical protein|uniref:Glycosyltransferase RgtA/B/C/D-like domain-containing protein n=1 Tax=candidate division WWE3 bacterium TaxID=2053526 RepID=A0A3A4ZBB5_UNCKA|nr:MAG: hypothetical protein C4561_04865 [candidate division WWE3 bacterium]
MTVENFLNGDITLHPYSGPTLFLQALIGMFFSMFFGISHLPVLTLFMACVVFYIFGIILVEFLNLKFTNAVLAGLLFFLNPLFIYEIWGFMTNHYFLVFFLLSFYFLLKYQRDSTVSYLILYVVLAFFALLIRQVVMALPLSVAIFYTIEFLKNRENRTTIRLAFLNLLVFLAFYAFYKFIFPLTPRMTEVPLQFHHLADFDYSFALIYGTLIVLSAYTLPLIFNILDFGKLRESFNSETKVQILTAFLLFFIASGVLYSSANKLFKPEEISWGEFPYFENVVERTGFFPRGIHGTKYYFAGSFDLWKYWDIAGKITLVLAVVYILRFKLANNIFSSFIGTYLMAMVVTETYYDRYILLLVPVLILYLISISGEFRRVTKFLLLIFIIFLGFLNYLFSADFLLVNEYVWNRSEELVQQTGAEPSQVLGTNAWKMTFRNRNRDYLYNFSYDNQEVNEDYRNNYTLVETKRIEYPVNIFVEPNIYLYKLNYEQH